MHIWKESNGTYSGKVNIGKTLKATCKGCKTFEEATTELLKIFI